MISERIKKIFPSANFLFYIFICAGVITLTVVRGLVPVLWNMPVHLLHIMNPAVPYEHEIDMVVYGVFFCVFFTTFILLLACSYGMKHWLRVSIWTVSFTSLIYLLLYPSFNITLVPVLGVPFGLVMALVVLFQFWMGKRSMPEAIIMILGADILLKYLTRSVIYFDIGGDPSVHWHYIYVVAAVVLCGCWYWGASKRIKIIERLKLRLNFVIPAIGISIIVLSLLRLMIIYEDGWDMNFTLLPAYHMIRGGVPFVNVVSQYGYLSLAPWMLWMKLFPLSPVSYETGLVTSTFFLIIYFIFLLFVCRKLFVSKIVGLVTAISCLFYTMVIRYFGFAAYKISLPSHPMFTPLRFGIFIVPLWFLMRFIETKKRHWFLMFIAISVLGLFFSIEIGIGLLAGALVISSARAITTTRPAYALYRDIRAMFVTFFCCLVVLFAYAFIVAYIQYAKMFSGGFYQLAVGSQVAYQFPLFMAIAGMIVGAIFLFQKSDARGMIVMYLATILLMLFPYYFGRSLQQTLYNIIVPFLLLSGMYVDYVLLRVRVLTQNVVGVVIFGFCVIILLSGTVRTIVITLQTVSDLHSVIGQSYAFIQSSFSDWSVTHLPEYAFLRRHLPEGCSLASMDAAEGDLLIALHAMPAFDYSFLRGTINMWEQMDHLNPKLPFCLFVNQAEYNLPDGRYTYVYHALWDRAAPQAVLIAEDAGQGFRLYKVSGWR